MTLADNHKLNRRRPRSRPACIGALFIVVACDSSPSQETKRATATDEAAPVEQKAAPVEAKPAAAIAVVQYPKAIVGKWAKVKSMISVPGSEEPFDAMAPGIEQFVEFTTDGKFVNSGIVEGKAYATDTTYTLDGAAFRVGSNEPIAIESITADALVTKTTTEAGTAVDEYRRVK